MQKGDLAKLRLLLSGIAARLDKNRDYFVQADCTFTSGKKKFPAKLTRAEENYVLRFQGSTRPADADSFCAFFIEQARNLTNPCLYIRSAARWSRCRLLRAAYR